MICLVLSTIVVLLSLLHQLLEAAVHQGEQTKTQYAQHDGGPDLLAIAAGACTDCPVRETRVFPHFAIVIGGRGAAQVEAIANLSKKEK